MKLGRTFIKSSLLATSLAVLGTSAALADEIRQDSKSTAVYAPSNLEQFGDRGSSLTSSTPASEFKTQREEAKLAFATYVPSYRTGLKWKK